MQYENGKSRILQGLSHIRIKKQKKRLCKVKNACNGKSNRASNVRGTIHIQCTNCRRGILEKPPKSKIPEYAMSSIRRRFHQGLTIMKCIKQGNEDLEDLDCKLCYGINIP